jgi:osmotically-inducible protein OsmY
MFRALFRLVFVVVLLIVAAGFLGYRWSDVAGGGRSAEPVVGTSGTANADRIERAREAGAKLGDKVATGAERAGVALEETRLTAKIKSKIALDDTLKGTDVDVHTSAATVTLSGQVSSAAQHERVLQLARETDGVTSVKDRVTVKMRN